LENKNRLPPSFFAKSFEGQDAGTGGMDSRLRGNDRDKGNDRDNGKGRDNKNDRDNKDEKLWEEQRQWEGGQVAGTGGMDSRLRGNDRDSGMTETTGRTQTGKKID